MLSGARTWCCAPVPGASVSKMPGELNHIAQRARLTRTSPDGAIRLHWAGGLGVASFEKDDPGQGPGHLDTVEALWTLYDVATTPRFAIWRVQHLPANW